MEVLVAAVRTGSFSRAGARVGITASGAAKVIGRLEQRLGVQLVQRTTRAMQLTEAGELYYQRASRVLEDIDGIERELEGYHSGPRGRIRVTAPSGIGHDLVMPVLIAFQRRCPEISVEMDLTDRVVDLVMDGFDIAIRVTDRPPEAFVARKLGDDHRTVCASPGYLLHHGRPTRRSDLVEHRCITYNTPGGPERWYLRREPDGKDEAVTVEGSLALNSVPAVRQAVLAGLGIANLPASSVADDIAAGTLIPLLGEYTSAVRTIYAIYAAARPLPAKIRAFLDILEATFQVPAVSETIASTPKNAIPDIATEPVAKTEAHATPTTQLRVLR
jgi:DNA-binding transcriptional LysR family regulator